MTTWPNWVDLIIVTLVLRACYNGFGRGILAELLSLIGAVSVTALTVNYTETVKGKLGSWLWFNPSVNAFLVFWGLFLILLFAVRLLLRRVTEVLKWERVSWLTQGIGMVLGGVRGVWWSGFIILALSSSGFSYLQESVEHRSLLGPRLLELSQANLERIADQFPGAQGRGETLIPPAKPNVKSK